MNPTITKIDAINFDSFGTFVHQLLIECGQLSYEFPSQVN
jgi:hypothetical protein